MLNFIIKKNLIIITTKIFKKLNQVISNIEC